MSHASGYDRYWRKGTVRRERHITNVSELLRFTDGRHTFYRATCANGYCMNLDDKDVYYKSEICHKKLTQVDMDNARIFGQSAADRIHRDDILRVVVAYGLQVAELPRHGLFRAEQVNGLYIEPALIAHGNEIHLSITEYAHRNLEPLCDKMVVDGVLHHFLDAAAQVEPEAPVSEAVDGDFYIAAGKPGTQFRGDILV